MTSYVQGKMELADERLDAGLCPLCKSPIYSTPRDSTIRYMPPTCDRCGYRFAGR